MIENIKLFDLTFAVTTNATINNLIDSLGAKEFSVNINCTTAPRVTVIITIEYLIKLTAEIELNGKSISDIFNMPVFDGWQLKILR